MSRLARRWPLLIGGVAYLISTAWSSFALVRLQAAAGAPIPLALAAAFQGISFGSWVPFAFLVDRFVSRLGVTGRLLACLYATTLVGGLAHAALVVAMQRALLGATPSWAGFADRLPIDLLLAVAVTAFVAAVRTERTLSAERRRAANLEAALYAARSEAARAVPSGAHRGEPLLVSAGTARIPVPPSSVEWFAAAGNYVVVNWAGREGLIRDTLADLQARLDPTVFARAHRSAIVNLARVRETAPLADGGWVLRTETGGEVVLSRTYRDAVLGRLGRR